MKKDTTIQQIEADIKSITKNAPKYAVELIQKDFESAKNQILNDFYSYSPKSDEDNRYGGLYNAVTVKGGYKTTNKVDMILTGSKMTGSYGHDGKFPKQNVLDLIWNQGVRGLPEKGTQPLKESYTYLGNHFEKGDIWENPYWDPSEYGNEFRTKIVIGKYKSIESTPTEVMTDFVNNWGKYRMDDVFDEAMTKAYKEL